MKYQETVQLLLKPWHGAVLRWCVLAACGALKCNAGLGKYTHTYTHGRLQI